MDNTELHYLTYDPTEIWVEIAGTYAEAGGDILYPGDEKEMLLRSVQADIVQVFAGVDNALRMSTLRYAVGEYLDVIGENRGCERITATAATATVTITTNATGEVETIPAGTGMTSDGEKFYLLTEDITLTGYQQTFTADIEAAEPGTSGNGLLAGTEMSLAITNTSINSIVVATDASGGNEREDDEPYRERIRQHGLRSVTTGPSQQYEEVAKSVSSEIVDAKAICWGAAYASQGIVNVYLIVSAETGIPALILSVQEALSDVSVRPLTDNVTVSLATDIEYTLNVQYQSDGSSAVTTAIAEAVEEYQEWQDGSIGAAFNPDRLMASLYRAGATRVVWGTGSEFGDGGAIEYTTIARNERCKGTITLSALT